MVYSYVDRALIFIINFQHYNLKKVYTKEIEVEDSGNCALKCTNAVGEEWYVQIQSIMGELYILKFGPVVDGIDILDWDFDLSYNTRSGLQQSFKGRVCKDFWNWCFNFKSSW